MKEVVLWILGITFLITAFLVVVEGCDRQAIMREYGSWDEL